ncbi:MAG: PD-(D/E)XK nuclease-like domain-containing protein [Halanaerobiales bacterium]|nr:PD-(D/E)XK nuclease-like domain-containing protein [Halanaerobiales bacterium]
MSVSLLKNFLPYFPYYCPAKKMAELRGDWEPEKKPAFLLGNYVHSWNQNRLQDFTSKHPELFKQNGDLYAKYKKGDYMINALKNDEYISKVRAGGKEKIFTASLFNVDWKIMIDIYNPEKGTFTDIKTVKKINERKYNTFTQEYQSWIEYYLYDYQMAIYAEIERLANGRDEGDYYVPHIAAVSKEDPPDKIVIHFPTNEENWIQNKLEQVEIALQDIIPVWKGEEEPERCERCEYCRSSKQLKKSIHYFDFIGE